MIVSLALILLLQLVGEVVARGTGLPLPGPVLGMALLFGFLVLRDAGPKVFSRLLPHPLCDGGLETTGKGLLAHLSLMFVPAGVGVVGRLDVIATHGAALMLVLIVSVVATLVATALTFVAVSRLVGRSGASDKTDEAA